MVPAAVTRLRTRTQPFEEIVESYFDGLFAACAGALQDHRTPEAGALYARALIRQGRFGDAVDGIASVIAALPALDHAQHGELMIHRASALVRLGRDDEDVRATIADARAHVYSALDPALEAELAFTESYIEVRRGDLDAAAHGARAVLAIPAGEPSRHIIPLEHSRARAYDLLAFVAGRREDDAAAQEAYRAAIAECDRCAIRDRVLEANLLTNLAIFAREFGDDGSVRLRLDLMGEGDHLRPQRYEILRSLAWSNALAGNHLGTFRDLREAAEAAPTIATKIRAIVDRAYFATVLGQRLIAHEELDYALRLSERVDWESVASAERELAALFFLGVALIPIDLKRARATIEKYRKLKPKLSPDLLAATDRRARAEDLAAEAQIARAEGRIDRAIELLEEAFAIWDGRGYRVRAAVVAATLAGLGAGARYAAYAKAEAALRPQAWFAAPAAGEPAAL